MENTKEKTRNQALILQLVEIYLQIQMNFWTTIGPQFDTELHIQIYMTSERIKNHEKRNNCK